MNRILFITHTLSTGGGAEKILSDLLSELSKFNFSINVVERLECSTNVYELPKEIHKIKSMTFTSKYITSNNLKRAFFLNFNRRFVALLTFCFPRRVYSFFIKEKFDYEISFNYLYPSYLVANSVNKFSKKIMWIHGSVYDLDYFQYKGLKRIVYYFYNLMQSRAFQKADIIVSTSINTDKSLKELFPKYYSKVKLIYNGYNFNMISKKSEEISVPIKKRKFRLISCGRLDENKNTILQLEALTYLLSQNIDVELLILGEGKEKDKLFDKAKELNICNNVEFLGFVENQYAYIKTADVLLLSSFQEGFPTVVVEALSIGVPVVATYVGGIEELIKPGVNGFISDWNPVSYSMSIEKAIFLDVSKSSIIRTVEHLALENWTDNVIKVLKE